jgi:pimeloyl-ACP methyl ester carboxylesterase
MRKNSAPRMDPALQKQMAARVAAGEFAGDEVGRCRNGAWMGLRTNWPDSTQWYRAPDVCDSPNEVGSRYNDFVPRLIAKLGLFDFREGLSRFRLPLLVVHGDRDNPPLGGSEEWVAGMAQGRLLVMPGMGHWPQFERPAELLAALRAFLDGGWPTGAMAVPKAPAAKAP